MQKPYNIVTSVTNSVTYDFPTLLNKSPAYSLLLINRDSTGILYYKINDSDEWAELEPSESIQFTYLLDNLLVTKLELTAFAYEAVDYQLQANGKNK